MPHKATLNRTQPASVNKDWSGGPGVAGSSPVSPTDARLEFATRGCAVCLGACAPTWCSGLTRNDDFTCKRHHSPQVRPDAAAHSKRLWQPSAYIALTVLTASDRVEVRQILDTVDLSRCRRATPETQWPSSCSMGSGGIKLIESGGSKSRYLDMSGVTNGDCPTGSPRGHDGGRRLTFAVAIIEPC